MTDLDTAIAEANKAVGNYTSDRSVAILFPGTSGKRGVGSSTCIRIADRLLLATAAHVILDFEDGDLELCPRGEASRSRLRIVDRSPRPGSRRPAIDVAWVEVDPIETTKCGLRPVRLEDVVRQQAHDPQSAFLIQGYPHESVIQSSVQIDLESTGLLTLSADPSGLTLPSTARRDLVLEWPPHEKGVEAIGVPKPHGISGGGVWRIPGFANRTIWSAEELRLVAVNRAWHQNSRLALATRMGAWLDLVARDLPELRAEIAKH